MCKCYCDLLKKIWNNGLLVYCPVNAYKNSSWYPGNISSCSVQELFLCFLYYQMNHSLSTSYFLQKRRGNNAVITHYVMALCTCLYWNNINLLPSEISYYNLFSIAFIITLDIASSAYCEYCFQSPKMVIAFLW